MSQGQWSKRVVVAVVVAMAGASGAWGQTADVSAEIAALKARIAELEAKSGENWLTKERTEQIRGIVQDVLKDAKTRETPDFGYKDGFYLQSPDKNFKLVIGGFAQVRYEAAIANATNGRSFSSRTVATGQTTTPDNPGNSNGFDIRRARINLSGNVFTPDLTFKLEGDFYGNATGNFTVTDAFVAYKFNDLLRVKAGSYKVPFAKAELTSDTSLTFMERPEELLPFDPQRAIGFSLYGDIVKDQLQYEVAVNNGGANSNNLRRNDTAGLTANLDNRLGFYGRMQWAGNGKLSDFSDESDVKGSKDFIWMLGAAAGYESQNSTNNAFPSPQTTGTIPGLSNGNGAGFTNYTLNGDVYRGTMDWSAKYHGLSLLTAAYIQQVNANQGNTSSTSSSTITTGPFGATDASFFQWGTYGQVGFFVLPHKLELVGRAGLLATEGYSNIGEFYSVGANYYVYGQNLKIQSDVTYSPEAAYTDSAASLIQNTHDVIFRLQLQVKF